MSIVPLQVSSHIQKDCPLSIVRCPYGQVGCTAEVMLTKVSFLDNHSDHSHSEGLYAKSIIGTSR